MRLKERVGKCEICGNADKKILHEHHIIERTELNTSNHEMNLCVICPNCHGLVHSGKLEIIGIYPSTKPPLGRSVIFSMDGKRNIDGIDEMYYKPKRKSVKIQ